MVFEIFKLKRYFNGE